VPYHTATAWFALAVRVAIAAACTVTAAAHAASFSAAVSSDDNRVLTIDSTEGPFAAPTTQPGQEGFAQPRVSDDGRFVGWLALQANCCTSYPIPLTLVILGEGNILRRFDAAPPIWDWAFHDHGAAVAYRQRPTHGSSWVMYELRRVDDGKLLAHFECDPDSTAGSKVTAAIRVPSWVLPIARECPVADSRSNLPGVRAGPASHRQ